MLLKERNYNAFSSFAFIWIEESEWETFEMKTKGIRHLQRLNDLKCVS